MYVPYNPIYIYIYISALSFPNSMKVERCSKYGNTQKNLGVTRSDYNLDAHPHPIMNLHLSIVTQKIPKWWRLGIVWRVWGLIFMVSSPIYWRDTSMWDRKSDSEDASDHPILGNPISVEVVSHQVMMEMIYQLDSGSKGITLHVHLMKSCTVSSCFHLRGW